MIIISLCGNNHNPPGTMANEKRDKTSAAEDEIDEEEGNKQKKVVGKHDTGAADLAKVMDYGFYDEDGQAEAASKDVSGAMSIIGDKKSREDAERVARQLELAKVSISKEDVALIMDEMEIPKNEAELKLRQARGNVVQALGALINE